MKLAEVATISARRENRQGRLTTWEEFEPLLNQIRQALNCSNNDAMCYMGYSGGTMLHEWKRAGVPILACKAAKGLLAELNIKLEHPIERQFAFDELTAIFAALNQWHLPDDVRKTLIKKTARELQGA